MVEQKYVGPTWDNSDEFSSLSDPKISQYIKQIESILDQLDELSLKLKRFVPKATKFTPPETNAVVPLMQECFVKAEEMRRLNADISTYASCAVSVNGMDKEAKVLITKTQGFKARLSQAMTPLELIVANAASDTINKYVNHEVIKDALFDIERARLMADYKLSDKEEELIVALGVDGFEAWANLYDNLSGAIQCEVSINGDIKRVGLATAAAMQEDESLVVRKAAFLASNEAWSKHKETCAAILNSLAGTRLEINKRRSYQKPVHFLDPSLFQARISRETLDAIMSVTEKSKSFGQRTLRAQAKALKVDQLGPWDRFVPAPTIPSATNAIAKMTFMEACAVIRDACAQIHPEMGDFVQMMVDKKWIDASVGDAKRPGAYCTKFNTSRNPRVYMTYTGGMKDVLTLAHELGHAFHNWKMKSIPRVQSTYPMTLAETASTFAETLVMDALMKSAQSPAELFKIQWSLAREAEGMLLNVSSRFTFEKEFYEQRQKGFVSAEDLSALMVKHWKHWYGDALSEMDPYFWCSKLHFHKTTVSFYNYPYIFGLLFALGVYAQKDKMGSDFYPAYVSLLQDTGRMTAEDVAMKHLNVDIRNEQFWQDSLNIVGRKVGEFEAMVDQYFC